MNVSHGTLLDGGVRYSQPVSGYRTGIEPVLLAAAVPARAGELVLEAGTGAGAGLLCLAARVADIRGVGVERNTEMAALARTNFTANGFTALRVVDGDVLAWRGDEPFDHAFANPPWHNVAGTVSPAPGRAAAKVAADGLLAHWAAAMGRQLRPRGTLTLIVPAARLAEATAALLGASCPEVRLYPLWPRLGTPAKMLILTGIRAGQGPCAVHPGIVLHEDTGAFSAAAQAILRGGAALLG